jgi:hypothetical protein
MKNIHIIKTDNPSRLGYLTKKGKEVFKDLRLFDKPMPNILDSENQNIYITSDEEISGLENNIWVYNNGRVWLWENTMALVSNNKPRKIISTTDPTLIADGVQAIDDDFLEWFVKNPSCERVGVELFPKFSNNLYGIILPKEETKQCSFCKGTGESKYIDINDGTIPFGIVDFDKYSKVGRCPDCNLEPKQEFTTVNGTSDCTITVTDEIGKPIPYCGGLEESKQERMYREEEVLKLWNWLNDGFIMRKSLPTRYELIEWFKQFEKE